MRFFLSRWLLLFAAVLSLAVFAFAVGRFPAAPAALLASVWAKITGMVSPLPDNMETVIWQIRAPRVAAALLVGAALAAAGSAYQNMFRNPLVAPDILGVSAGAALGAVAAIFFSLPALGIQLGAFVGGLAAVSAVYAIGSSVGVRGGCHDVTLTLILAGVVIGTLLTSCIALLKYLADPYNQLPAMTFWLLGSLSGVVSSDLYVVAPLMLFACIPLFLTRWRINLLSLSEDEARAMGVNTTRLRIFVVCAATLLTASAVAIGGIIGWIGLLVPHAARFIVGPDFSRLLPASMLLGGAFLLLVDTISRTAAPIEMPPGVLTAFIGTPFFIWLLASKRRSW